MFISLNIIQWKYLKIALIALLKSNLYTSFQIFVSIWYVKKFI